MKLIANYEPLSDEGEGSKQMLWGEICVLENVGTEKAPSLVYTLEIKSEKDAKAQIDTGRFQKAE